MRNGAIEMRNDEKEKRQAPSIDEPDEDHPEPQSLASTAPEERRQAAKMPRETGTGPKE